MRRVRHLRSGLEAGQYIAIIGESVLRNSTLLNLVAGVETVDAGRATFNDPDFMQPDIDWLTLPRRDQFDFVFQVFDRTSIRLQALPVAEVDQSSGPLLADIARTSRHLSSPAVRIVATTSLC